MNLYPLGQISKAANALSNGWAVLPERVQEAWGYLCILKDSDLSGFEKEFEIIRQCLVTVRAGNWSRVTNEEYRTVASIITEMNLVGTRSVTIKEDVRVLASAGSGIGGQGYCENN